MLRVIFTLAVMVLSLPVQADRIVYERVFPLGSPGNDTLRIEIAASGDVTIQRPDIMTLSGRHEGVVDPSVYSELRGRVVGLDVDIEALEARWQARQRDEMITVTDPETTVIRLLGDEREPGVEMRVSAVQPRARLAGNDDAIARLAALEDDLWKLMEELLREVKS